MNDRENGSSLRAARSVTGGEPEAFTDGRGRPALRFALNVDEFALDLHQARPSPTSTDPQ